MIWSPNFFTIMNDDVDELLDSLLSNKNKYNEK